MASSGDGGDTTMHGQITNTSPLLLPEPQSQQPGGPLLPEPQSQQPGGPLLPEPQSQQPGGLFVQQSQTQQPRGLFARQSQSQQPGGPLLPELQSQQPRSLFAPRGLFAPQSQSKPQSPSELENGGLSPVSPLSEAAGLVTYRKATAEDESQPPVATELPNNSSGQQTSSNDPQAEIKRILQCRPNEWYTILGVSDTCSTDEAHQAYKRLALIIHPDRCKLEGATDAAALVITSANALKAGDDYEGRDSQPSGPDGKRPKPQKGPELSDFHKEIYEEATPLIGKILLTEAGPDITTQLDKLNKKIRTKNLAANPGANELEKNRGVIDWGTFTAYSGMSRTYSKLLEEDPATFTGTEKEKKGKKVSWDIAKKSLPKIGPIIDAFNKQRGYPPQWNWDPTSFPQFFGTNSGPSGNSQGPRGPKLPGSTTSSQDPPWQPREPDTTREGHPILGARQFGKRGYRFVVANGKNPEDDNPIEYRSGAELGYDIADAYLAGKKKEEWDITKMDMNVSREADAKNYRGIMGIAMKPIKRNGTISFKPRYPEAHMVTRFERPDGEEYNPILNKAKLGKVIGGGAAEQEMTNFYERRPKLTLPWATQPRAITFGEPRAIDAVPAMTLGTLPTATPGMAFGTQTATPRMAFGSVAPAAPTPAATEQLLLKNEVEGLKDQIGNMLVLLQQMTMNAPARVPVMA